MSATLTPAKIKSICELAAAPCVLNRSNHNQPWPSPSAATQAAKDYVALAKKLGVDPSHWLFDTDPGYNPGYRQLRGAAFELLTSGPFEWKEAVEIFVDAGANPWISLMTYSSSFPGELEDYPQGPEAIGRLIFGATARAGMRSLLLKSALLTLDLAPKHALKALLEAYQLAVEPSSKTAKGVMGSADKLAKSACETLLSRRSELAAAAQTPAQAKAAAGALADATERLAAKKDASAAVDPAKLKKQTSPERRSRIAALLSLVCGFPQETDLISAAFATAPWLAETPMLASVSFSRGSLSLVQAALRFGCAPALEALEAMDANIWLAAAQAGEGNACRWAIGELGPGDGEAVERVSRMLMRGAWLDGSKEPKERCLALCRELSAGSRAYGYESSTQFLAAMERESLEDIISGPTRANPAPPKRKRSL